MYCVCKETTSQVLAERRKQREIERLSELFGIDTEEHAFDEVAVAWDVNKKNDVRSVIRIRN